MLAFGPHRGEALAMRWSLTDLDAPTTKLRKQFRRVRGERDETTGRRRGRLIEKDLKTDESRATLSLPLALVEMLRAHRRDQVARRLASKVSGSHLHHVGGDRDRTAQRQQGVVGAVRSGRGEDPAPRLRHAAASLAFAECASVKEVQTMLRHTRESTTSDLYVHVFESVRRGTADRMDSVPRKIMPRT
jgi:integrase